MSGGHFDYAQDRIKWQIIEPIEELIAQNEVKPDWMPTKSWEEDGCRRYTKETVAEFYRAIHYLRKAAIYTHRIDWLVSGDDDEDDFHRRLVEDLKNESTLSLS